MNLLYIVWIALHEVYCHYSWSWPRGLCIYEMPVVSTYPMQHCRCWLPEVHQLLPHTHAEWLTVPALISSCSDHDNHDQIYISWSWSWCETNYCPSTIIFHIWITQKSTVQKIVINNIVINGWWLPWPWMVNYIYIYIYGSDYLRQSWLKHTLISQPGDLLHHGRCMNDEDCLLEQHSPSSTYLICKHYNTNHRVHSILWFWTWWWTDFPYMQLLVLHGQMP